VKLVEPIDQATKPLDMSRFRYVVTFRYQFAPRYSDDVVDKEA